MKLSKIILALGAVSAAPCVFAANPASYSTNAIETANVKHLETGIDTDTPVYKDKASIKIVDNTAKGNVANNKPVAFAKMDKVANNPFVKKLARGVVGKDRNGVTVANLYRMTGAWHLIPRMPDHSKLGRLSYAQVGNLDVYFGDWSNVAPGAAIGTRGTNYTAFYSGTGRTTNLPTTGTATYTVKGINQYHTQNTALLNGTLKADFGKRTLNGEMKRTGLTVAVNNAAINTAQASFKGKATANKVAGTAHGHFFGNQGAAIAGVADFGRNHAYNTAFGGTKTGK